MGGASQEAPPSVIFRYFFPTAVGFEAIPDKYNENSFSIVSTNDGKIEESETDFIVFNQNLGILCIEAKAGRPEYKNNRWYWERKRDGP